MATISRRGKSYRIRVYLGYDYHGKQIERTMTWTPPAGMSDRQAEKEAQKQAILFEESIKAEQTVDGNIRFHRFAELWFEQYAVPQLRSRTVARYRELLESINEYLGHVPLAKITPTLILNYYTALRERSAAGMTSYICKRDLRAILRANGETQTAFCTRAGISETTLRNAFNREPVSETTATKIAAALNGALDKAFKPATPAAQQLSATTIRHHHRLLSSILGTAVKWQYITYNPCSRIAAPKAERSEIECLTENQARQMLDALQKEPGYYRRAITLLLLTGLRRSELLGLEWQDVDWSNQRITICRTSQCLPGRGVYTENKTKNHSSARIVTISTQAIQILQEQYAWQILQSATLGDKWNQNNRIITGTTGAPMHPNTLSHWFAKFIHKTNLPPIHIHCLRHTYATLAIAKGCAIPAVAKQLGHADSATTCRIYAHALESSQAAVSDVLGSLMDTILQDNTTAK